jgi:hypothetical protein
MRQRLGAETNYIARPTKRPWSHAKHSVRVSVLSRQRATPDEVKFCRSLQPIPYGSACVLSKTWLALFALGAGLDRLGREKDMQAALSDGALLYDEILRLDTNQNGPLLAPGVIQGLHTINVDFSIPVRDWLANPQFTPYPAISQALLLMRRKLKMPVFIDVIVSNYEHKVTSPRLASDVKSDVLQAAILDGYNGRYGTQIKNFEDILVPQQA